MNVYPQIGTGTVAQFPVTRSRRWRSISNRLESGEIIQLPDTTAGQIEWKLTYRELTATEVQSLNELFSSSGGGYGAFTFIDPLANLFGWSEDLTQPVWQTGLLHTVVGVSDPLGTQRATSVANLSAGPLAVQQTVAVPGAYTACFSAYVRSSAAGVVTLQRDGKQEMVNVGSAWNRVFMSGTGTNGATQSNFSFLLAAGQTIDIWGLQLEAQPCPSAYKLAGAPLGIYEETYFAGDELKITSTSPLLSSCQITLMSRV